LLEQPQVLLIAGRDVRAFLRFLPDLLEVRELPGLLEERPDLERRVPGGERVEREHAPQDGPFKRREVRVVEMVARDVRGRPVRVQAASPRSDVCREPDTVLPVLAEVPDRVDRMQHPARDFP
jgi:hypothetical protein